MGLSWQQGPLSRGAIGRFLVPEPLPQRLLYVEPLRRHMRVRFFGAWVADSEHVLLLFEPGRYPVAYFPETDVSPEALERTEQTTRHPDLGLTSWYTVRSSEKRAPRGAWQHIDLPAYASELRARIAFAWPTMDAFYEEDERIMGHAADSYHRIDIRQASRNLVVRHHDRVVADTKRPMVPYEIDIRRRKGRKSESPREQRTDRRRTIPLCTRVLGTVMATHDEQYRDAAKDVEGLGADHVF
jgi:uncharacterized protein (DUF427 family)